MFERYKVKSEDTISLIAKKFNTNIEMLKNINDIYFLDNIREGMDLIVPKVNEQYYEVVKIKKDGKIIDVSKMLNVNPNLFAKMNGFDLDDYIYLNQEVIVPKPQYSYYITSEGDTIKTACDILNISKDRLLSQNQTIYLLPDQILVNKKIK